MKRLWILVWLLVLAGCRGDGAVVASASPPPPEVGRPKLVAVGDSLTEGLGVAPEEAYPAQLERRLREDGLDWQVVNAGLSGETSSGALSRLDWVLRTEPDAVLLVTGANDGLRGVDPGVTESNLDAMVGRLRSEGVKVMLGGMKAPPNLGADYGRAFEAVYPAVANKYDVPLIPFFLEGVAKRPELNQKDGKHPNAEGYTRVVEAIFPTVSAWLRTP